MNRYILHPDGTKQPLDQPYTFQELYPLVGYDFFERIGLRDGTCMLVDEQAYLRDPQPPINYEASRLYHSVCYPGTTHMILGTVAVVPEEDFFEEEDEEDEWVEEEDEEEDEE